MITNLSLYKNFWLHYDWIIKFQIWDKKYESAKIDDIVKDYWNRYINLTDITGSDFRLLNKYNQSDSIIFEIELINDIINPKKFINYLYSN